MPDWSKIGLALSGFGAGVQGQGMEFIQAQEQQKMREQLLQQQRSAYEQQSRDERARRTALNMRGVAEALKGPRPSMDRAITLLNQSVLAAADQNTQAPILQLKQMIEGGQTEQAMQILDVMDRQFTAMGVVPERRANEPVRLGQGDRLVDPRTGQTVTENPAAARTGQDQNGVLRYLDGPNQGKPVFPEVEKVLDFDAKDYDGMARNFRNEIGKANSDFYKIADSWDRIAASADTPSAAGDLALIFNFMKMLDPGSTVREGEFANAQNAAGVPGRIRSLYGNLIEGTRLTPEQRQDFFGQAQNIFQAAEARATQLTEQYVNIGRRMGIRPEDIRVDRGAPPDVSGAMQQNPPPPQGTGLPRPLTPEEREEYEQLQRELREQGAL